MNEYLSKLYAKEIGEQYFNELKLMRHLREWQALPWYVRAWRRLRVRVYHARIRLGEIVAGREFE